MNNFEKYPHNPVLGNDDLGTCFDVYVWKDNGKYRMDFSWRKHNSAAVSFSDDGITWSAPIITLAPNFNSGWEFKREGETRWKPVCRPGCVWNGRNSLAAMRW